MSTNRMASYNSPNDGFTGQLLVATPRVPTGFPFSRTVILVLQDSDEGVFGVVLNRPATPDMLLAWQKVAGQPTFAAEKLVSGGPVQGPILAIHRQQDLAEVEIDGGLFVSVQQEAIEKLSLMELDEENAHFRIVLGAVSWEKGLLENEIDNGAWFVVDGQSDLVFAEPSTMWERCVRRFGAQSIREMTGIIEFPADPLLN